MGLVRVSRKGSPYVPSPQNTLKAELKDFTIIDRGRDTLHNWAKEALYIHIKDPSLNRNTGKVRIPSVFNKLLKPPTQLELPHNLSPDPRGAPSLLGLSTQKTIIIHALLISIYNRSVIPMFTPFKLQDNWDFRSPPSKKHIWKQILHIRKCYNLQKVFKLQLSGLLISSLNKVEEGTI